MPASRCSSTAASTARSSTCLRPASDSVPASRPRLASASSGGRSRLPTTSARISAGRALMSSLLLLQPPRLVHRRRSVRVEGGHRGYPPRLAAGALRLRPDDRLEVGIEHEVSAGRHLDAVAGRLVPVEEEALGDRVLGGRELDV